VLGGIIPNSDIPQMKARGVAEVFQPGASMESIVTFIRSHVRQAA
jgi:methylmalonyl-CoA mutase C-terminal domain/subunit